MESISEVRFLGICLPFPLMIPFLASSAWMGGLQPWGRKKKQAAYRNDCVITIVIQSGPHIHARTSVGCQIRSGLTGGGCGAGLCGPDGPLASTQKPRPSGYKENRNVCDGFKAVYLECRYN